MKNENKKLSRKQIQAITLCNGEFGGLSEDEAAKEMNTTQQAVSRLLKRAEEICPAVFPLLTKREADVLSLLNIGWSNNSIGEKLDLADYTVSKVIKALEDKGRGIADSSPVEMKRYEPHMDDKIKEKF